MYTVLAGVCEIDCKAEERAMHTALTTEFR